MYRAWIELSRKALEHNLSEIQKHLDPQCRIMAVVKANAYGHGAELVTDALQKMGIRDFAVATLEEGIALRKNGITGQIVVLGETIPSSVGALLEYRLTQTIVSAEYAQRLAESVRSRKDPSENGGDALAVHVALDTGMHRIGLDSDDAAGIRAVYQTEGLNVTGIFTHSDLPQDITFTELQIRRFFRAVDRLKADGIEVKGTHVQNSYACVNYSPQPCSYARLGLLLYGIRSGRDDYLKEAVDLWPVMSLYCRITSVRAIEPGETVGYGRTFQADQPSVIATLGIGYADGIPRALSNGKMKVLVRGKAAPVVGRICMDQMMLDVTDIPGVKEGDLVTIIGRDGEESRRCEDLAEGSGTITYEIISRLSSRIENHGFVEERQ